MGRTCLTCSSEPQPLFFLSLCGTMQLVSLLPLIFALATFAAPAETIVGRSCHEDLSIHDLGGLPAPKNPVSFVLLGVGTQNYTCSSTGTYASAGAVARLFDVSCISNTDLFPRLTKLAYDIWTTEVQASASSVAEISSLLENVGVIFGDHYFVTSPTGTGITPKWDATSGAFKGNPNAYMLGAKAAGVSAPTGSFDIDWLYLTNLGGSVGGKLADGIYRTSTNGGQPPASCTPGESTTVKYTAFYCA
ncbi:hypothetical protein E1B28_006575 [Marasmius oreades]|uniref:Malate dehydrogenase n=1 Tax=Marasmius oreades TaxID=181124 RepID=A0A9P7S6W2_9AGAR|nr:uncharacterized protein E1B28_006575 [Marasmius oreades]KAG7095887.1 hypothetical protein E1B28_006575 [Marasmius oreades]